VVSCILQGANEEGACPESGLDSSYGGNDDENQTSSDERVLVLSVAVAVAGAQSSSSVDTTVAIWVWVWVCFVGVVVVVIEGRRCCFRHFKSSATVTISLRLQELAEADAERDLYYYRHPINTSRLRLSRNTVLLNGERRNGTTGWYWYSDHDR